MSGDSIDPDHPTGAPVSEATETPKTDEAEGDAYEFQHNLRVVPAAFARTLERENAALLKRVEEAEKDAATLRGLMASHNNDLRQMCGHLPTCEPYQKIGKSCPGCPVEYEIDVDAARRAGKE